MRNILSQYKSTAVYLVSIKSRLYLVYRRRSVIQGDKNTRVTMSKC